MGSGPVSTIPDSTAEGAACQCWLGTWPHDPCLGAARCCWLVPCSNDPLRCGLNSSSTNVTALRNLPQFAKFPQGCTVMPCFCIARQSHVLSWKLCATSLLVAWCHGWVGWGASIFFQAFLAIRDAAFAASGAPGDQKIPEGRRMDPGSRVDSPWVQAQCRQSLIQPQRGQHASAG